MITLRVEVPYASFRKSYARSFAETYPFPPPATVYGMLLSLVGETQRARHAGVQLAFAHRARPRVATLLRKLSRYKYGVAAKQSKLGNAPDYVETLCGLDFLCFVDSAGEAGAGPSLEERLLVAIDRPEEITRSGLLCLGLSDDPVDAVSVWNGDGGPYFWLTPSPRGPIELPTVVDHVGSRHTRWRRYNFEDQAPMAAESVIPERFVTIPAPGADAAPG